MTGKFLLPLFKRNMFKEIYITQLTIIFMQGNNLIGLTLPSKRK